MKPFDAVFPVVKLFMAYPIPLELATTVETLDNWPRVVVFPYIVHPRGVPAGAFWTRHA